jgi:hypothetical protein
MHDSRFTTWVVAVALFTTYVATLAPTITLWDSGEFNAAIGSLGIPHPPGTPLYIVLGRVWAELLGFLPQALAVNLMSAVATAVTCGLLGGLVTRWTGQRITGVAAGLSSGTMLAVWQNATETEIYALSMLLAVLMVVVGVRAGALDSARHRLALVYLMALAVPVQISALIAAPAAIVLAATRTEDARPDRTRLLMLGAALVIVAGFGLGSWWIAGLGLVGLGASVLGAGPPNRREAAGLIAVIFVGVSPTLFMLVRAAHDPLINQGNPSTVAALVDVIARHQYPLPGLWPRQAPIWAQLLNLVQYADWQAASGVDPSVAASWSRTPFSIVALMLAVLGARRLRAANARGFLATAVLLAMSSLGVVAVLNLRAGPSILDRVLPAGSSHEPRERDYFFALGFATAGMLVGTGAVVASRRWLAPGASRLTTPVALTLAGLPLLLNWSAANRRPDAALATTLGESLLASAPPNAVLLVAGDNDSYTTWYRQAVLDERRDVVPVTISLLPAKWYRAELARRYRLLDSTSVAAWAGETAMLGALVEAARRAGRPVSAAVSVPAGLRHALAPAWTLGGMAYVADFTSSVRGDSVDVGAVGAVADLVAASVTLREPRGRDPAVNYVARLLQCPADALRATAEPRRGAIADLLDSRCNFK